MEKRSIKFCHCGTEEDFEKFKGQGNYTDMHEVTLVRVYINDKGVCIVTSKEWADWMQNITTAVPDSLSDDCIPAAQINQEIRRKKYEH